MKMSTDDRTTKAAWIIIFIEFIIIIIILWSSSATMRDQLASWDEHNGSAQRKKINYPPTNKNYSHYRHAKNKIQPQQKEPSQIYDCANNDREIGNYSCCHWCFCLRHTHTHKIETLKLLAFLTGIYSAFINYRLFRSKRATWNVTSVTKFMEEFGRAAFECTTILSAFP